MPLAPATYVRAELTYTTPTAWSFTLNTGSVNRFNNINVNRRVGTHGWTMPIPLVKTAAGWRFDARGTPDELRTRRIGRNELDVIQVMLALTDAQEEYAANDRGRDGVSQ